MTECEQRLFYKYVYASCNCQHYYYYYYWCLSSNENEKERKKCVNKINAVCDIYFLAQCRACVRGVWNRYPSLFPIRAKTCLICSIKPEFEKSPVTRNETAQRAAFYTFLMLHFCPCLYEYIGYCVIKPNLVKRIC